MVNHQKLRTLLCLLVLATFCVSLLPTASAANRGKAENTPNGTFTVSDDSYDFFTFELDGSQVLDLNIEVTSGTDIDFYILTDQQFDKYKDPNAASFKWESFDEDTTSWDKVFDEDGDFVLVIDNAEISQSGATPTGDVTYDVELEVRDKSMWERIKTFLCYAAIVLAILAYIGIKANR